MNTVQSLTVAEYSAGKAQNGFGECLWNIENTEHPKDDPRVGVYFGKKCREDAFRAQYP